MSTISEHYLVFTIFSHLLFLIEARDTFDSRLNLLSSLCAYTCKFVIIIIIIIIIMIIIIIIIIIIVIILQYFYNTRISKK